MVLIQAGQQSPGWRTGLVPGGHWGHVCGLHSVLPNLHVHVVHVSCDQVSPWLYLCPL